MKKKREAEIRRSFFKGTRVSERSLTMFLLAALFVIPSVWFYFFSPGIFIHQENEILFIFSGRYLGSFLSHPGGLLVYAGNFLTQFYFHHIAGVLILSLIIFLQTLVFYRIEIHFMKGPALPFLFLIPSLLTFIIMTRYETPLSTGCGFLVVTSLFLLQASGRNAKRLYGSLVVFPLLFYITGSFAFIWAGLMIVHTVLNQKGTQRVIFISALLFIVFITVFISKEYLFYQPLKLLLTYPLVFSDISRISSLVLFISGVIIVYPLIIRFNNMFPHPWERYIRLATIAVAFPAVFFLMYRTHKPEYEKVMHLEKLVYQRNWDEILKLGTQDPSSNVVAQFYCNLALIERGQICNRLFFVPQDYASMSLPLERDNIHMFRSLYYYYALGLTGEAHHLAYETMVQHGYRPENIKMLIKTELINGNYKIAERYINVLKKTLYYREWAEKYRNFLYDPGKVKDDPELGQKLILMPRKDFFIMGNDYRNLDLLFESNPANILAFETKLARLLLDKDLLKIMDEVKKMKEIGYVNLPRHIEEAVIAFRHFAKQSPDLGGLTIKPETEERFKEYISLLNRYQGKKSLIDSKINRERFTFWYYLQFSTVRMDFERGDIDRNPFIY